MTTAALTIPDALIEAIATRTAEIVSQTISAGPVTTSPYMTIPEAAEYLRCKRQRIDDLLSSGRLTRHKEGTRTLVSRAELEARVR